jgi:Domain of unknown function (DUF5664)
MNTDEGLRYNEGKTLFDCIPPYAEKMLAEVLTQGAKKYEERNWEKGMAYSKVINSLMRHLNKFRMGEDIDEESGLPHTAHIAINAIFLLEYGVTHPEKDDRRKYTSKGKVEIVSNVQL